MCYRFILDRKIFPGSRPLLFLLFSVLCIFFSGASLFAASSPEEAHATIGVDGSLRQISEHLLGDKDAWPVILRCNGIPHLDAAPPGTTLRVPVGLYKKLSLHLERIASFINQANSVGAALLAKDDITEAEQLRDQALRLRLEARLQDAVEQAALAESKARVALDKARNGQNQATAAWLEWKSGTVENRQPEAARWQKTKLQQRFEERERVRTLADSRGRIKFSDQSQISLDEHALVVIGSMEKNVIRSSYSNSVSMIKGDIQFHLASISQQKRFKVKLPNITTDIRSLDFLTSLDEENVARIANYDGEIDISAGGGQVTVKKNQGTKIVPGQKPTKPKELLPPPTMLTPKPEQKFYGAQVLFTWKPVSRARRYQIELSNTSSFSMLLAADKISGQRFQWQAPSAGVYFFRIKTIDQDGCPGPFADPLVFSVDPDTEPPFLAIHSPGKDIQTRNKEIEVRGEVERNALLRINGQEVRSDDAGRFSYMFSLSGGSNVLHAKAVDAAGNISSVERTVTRQQDSQLLRLDNPGNILSKTEEVAISGWLLPGTRLFVNRTPVQARGDFTYLLQLSEGEHEIQVEALGQDGQEEGRSLHVLIDLHPPEIKIGKIKQAQVGGQVIVKGSVSEEGDVTLNEKPVKLTGLKFEETVLLREGNNELRLDVQDSAGNRNSWKKKVFRDSIPPEILKHEVSPRKTKGGEVVQLTVQAKDEGVGLARTGSFTLEVNGTPLKGVLNRSSEDSTMYTGNVFVLPGVSGAVLVREIRVQDLLGNLAEYRAKKKEK
ncbi:MAG: FecR domain-containing protein [Candidatus Electrothrix aestuarii]|uniref:FecR domain-containing protein n=1 Tax=Candidatus Electrothrix aestuarii TaxID=3062594 RepID=A0AAU8LQB9_9BACT|nr:FecR domain-containing protein [Candidatus Electrothrix aestuarii]